MVLVFHIGAQSVHFTQCLTESLGLEPGHHIRGELHCLFCLFASPLNGVWQRVHGLQVEWETVCKGGFLYSTIAHSDIKSGHRGDGSLGLGANYPRPQPLTRGPQGGGGGTGRGDGGGLGRTWGGRSGPGGSFGGEGGGAPGGVIWGVHAPKAKR